jgi:hypothetical protein
VTDLGKPLRHGRSNRGLILDNQYPRHPSSIEQVWADYASTQAADNVKPSRA